MPRWCSYAGSVFLFAAVALAQDQASLTVTVIDPSAAMVPGASVTVTDLRRGRVGSAETSEGGFVIFDRLFPGEYSIEIVKAGFSKYQIDNLTLNVRDRQALRAELQIAAAAGTRIVVSDRAEALSSDAAQGITVEQNYLQFLPANGRSAEALIAMAPGITSAAGGKGDGGFNANGLRSNANYYTLDGVSMNRGMGGGPGGGGGFGGRGGGAPMAMGGAGPSTEMISIDAMQEMRVQTSSFAPEFGRSPGAQVVMTSRGGSNQFHGALFHYLRNERFDANDWFANSRGYGRGRERQQRPGGTFGGPILSNRTFFFASYEQLDLESPTTVIATVPDLATRKAASAALRPYLDAFPLPNGNDLDSGGAEFRAVISNPSSNQSGSLRIDHLLTSSTTVFARYSQTPSSGVRRGSEMTSPNMVTYQSSRSQTATVGVTKTFGGGAVNDMRVNYSKSSASGYSAMDSFGGAIPLSASQIFPKGVTVENGSFNLSIMGFTSYSYGGRSSNRQDQINVVDSYSKVSGPHQYKFGIDYRRILMTNNRMPYSVSASFNGLVAEDSDSDYYFLKGVALNGQVSSSLTSVYPTYTNFSAYAQDTVRATDRTTVTYGLRWDVNPAPTTRSGPRPFALASSSIAGVTQNEPIYPTRWTDIAPRFGVAYLSDDKPGHEMMLRAGVGMFYDMGYGVTMSAFNGAPYSAVRTASGVRFPLSASELAPPKMPPTRPYGQITAGDGSLKSPVVFQWNGTWEKYFGTGQMLTVGVSGTKGSRLMRMENTPSFSDAYDILMKATNGASSIYNGLQLQFRKRMSASLQTQLSYTWSHSIDSSSSDMGMGGGGGGGGFASLFGEGQRGSSDYDVRHNISFSGSWRLFAPRRSILFLPIQNWYLDFVAAARSGLPFDVQGVSSTTSDSSDSNATKGLFAQVRPDYTGEPVWIVDRNAPGRRRLNKAAFSTPDGYTQGNLGRNALRGFGFGQLDLSLRRTLPITERLRVDIAAQGYNILNHPNFANVSPMEGGNMSSPNFGVVTRMMNQSFGGGVNALYRSGGARSMELSVRLQF